MRKTRLPRQYDDDDGRTIAPMDLPGMERRSFLGSFLPLPPRVKPPAAPAGERAALARPPEPEALDPVSRRQRRRETWALVRGAILSALLIGTVFVLCGYLLIQFCIHVWFA